MRRNIVLLCCMGVFVAFVLYVRIALTNDVNWVLGQATEVRQGLSTPSVSEMYRELDDHWNDRIVWWGTILPHEDLHKASLQIKRLGVAVENKDDKLASLAEEELRLTLTYLIERNSLRWDHVF